MSNFERSFCRSSLRSTRCSSRRSCCDISHMLRMSSSFLELRTSFLVPSSFSESSLRSPPSDSEPESSIGIPLRNSSLTPTSIPFD